MGKNKDTNSSEIILPSRQTALCVNSFYGAFEKNKAWVLILVGKRQVHFLIKTPKKASNVNFV